MIPDLMPQVKTANLLIHFLQGTPEQISPYPFVPYPNRQNPDAEIYGMEREVPEAQGVPSRTIADFYKALRDCPDIRVHSVAIMRHGKMITESSFQPYSSGCPHMMFSLSKSVVGMAVGLAVKENLFSVDDKLVDLFPEIRPPFRSARFNNITVRHLLTMTSGVKYNEVFSITDRDWVKGFLSSDCLFEPGTAFYYNSMNTYILSALICKKSGMSLVDFLMPRLFSPLGIPKPRWETCPMGIEKGGWGLYLRSVDMLKLGQLYLQHGAWKKGNKKIQVIPEQWVIDSTSNWIPFQEGNRPTGYGYQIRRFPAKDAYQFNGVFGQYVVVLPARDMVIAITSGSGQLFHDSSLEIIEKFFGDQAEPLAEMPLPNDVMAVKKLLDVIDHLYAEPNHPKQTSSQEEPPQKGLSRLFHALKASPEPKHVPSIPPLAKTIPEGDFLLEDGFASLMPLILRSVTNNFPSSPKAVRFAFEPDLCRCTFLCGESEITIDAGLQTSAVRSWIQLGGEDYFIGSSAELTTDEEDRTVLKLYIHFLQTPCTRLMKFIFYKDGHKVFLRMDELPSVKTATEMLFGLVDSGSGSLKEITMEAISKNRLRQRAKEIMRPRVKGTLISDELEKSSEKNDVEI
jgi:CubicO group peptidase (beta-lactamase class C family)